MKPILFNSEMVNAILEGRKTQTRRPHPSKSQKYHVGDVLYVRETFAKIGCIGESIDWFELAYRADFHDGKWQGHTDMCFGRWIPSIHMPKEHARIFLQVTDVWVGPVAEISDADAAAEGFGGGGTYENSPSGEFMAAWAAIYGPESTQNNARAYEFKVIPKPHNIQ